MNSNAKIDFSGDMHSGSKAWKTVWSAGQGVGLVQAQESIAEIVDGLKQGYSAAVQAQQMGSTYLAPSTLGPSP